MGSKIHNCTSLFVHFPTNDFKSHEQNVVFVDELLRILLKDYKK